MDRKPADEEHNNTETEEHTIARHKKRSRRVSFAETTSIHVFHREEDSETPPEPKPTDEENSPSGSPCPVDTSQNDNEAELDGEGNNDEEFDSRKSFLRPLESPSPGSSTFGSASLNDEDNFFGPVSASFIRPGRLSDSGTSNENHDVTLDSTAFSMHFHSLARSDFGGEFKTPTGHHPHLKEETPTDFTHGNAMMLTKSKKPASDSFVVSAKSEGCGDSNDMSLVGEIPRRYDYGRLSPGLDALLTEGSKDFLVGSNHDEIGLPKLPVSEEGDSSPFKNDVDNQDNEMSRIDAQTKQTELMPAVRDRPIVENGDSTASPICQLTYGLISDVSSPQVPDASVGQGNLSSAKLKNDISAAKNKESVKYSLESRRNILSDLSDRINQLNGSPRKGFPSCSPSKQGIMLLNSSSSSKHVPIATPRSQLRSFLSSEKTAYVESAISIQKSISRLNMLRASPFSSTTNAKAENQRFGSLDSLLKTPPLDTVLQNNTNRLEFEECGSSPNSNHELPLCASHKNEEPKSAINSAYDTIVGSSSVDATHFVDCNGEKSSMPLHHISGWIISPKIIEVATGESLSSSLTFSEKKIKKSLFTSETTSGEIFADCGTNSVWAEMKSECVGNLKDISPLNKFSSPKKCFETNSVVSPRQWRSVYTNLGPSVKNFVRSDSGQDSLARIPVNDAFPDLLVDKLDNISMVGKEASANEVCGVDRQQDMSGSGMFRHSEIPSKDGKFHDPTNLQAECVASSSEDYFVSGGTRDAPHNSSSPIPPMVATEVPPEKNPVKWFNQGLPGSEHWDLMHHDDLRPTRGADLTFAKSNQLTDEFSNPCTLKRTKEEVFDYNGAHLHVAKTKLQKSGGCCFEFLEHQNKGNSRIDHELQHWTHRCSRFSGSLEKLLPSSVDKLSVHAIQVLEDFLVDLLRSTRYEMLSSHIRSQRRSDSSNPQYSRLFEAKLLTEKLVHEHAKLKLMCVKKERLLKRIFLLHSEIEECQRLNLPSLSQFFVLNTRVDDVLHQSSPANLVGKLEVLEASKRRITSLTKSFHISYKLKGEPSSEHTIALVRDQLMKRACCSTIRQNLQLWVLESLESKSSHYDIVLNYLNILIQRLSVKIGPLSSFFISNKLNCVNIMKSFPNMDASVAFSFVLNKETTQKFGGPGHLMQETQITGSLLGNLLDVVEEVQLAQAELRNLSQTNFHSSSEDQLDLNLTFFDFKSGKKVALILDTSCLNRGIYPSKVVPSQLIVLTDGRWVGSSQPLLAKIEAAIQGLKAGYLWIIRLCRCVSKVVQDSSG